jgi:uncharacterized protein with PQ loop repeat
MIVALGFLAAAFSIALIWPQVWLSCRHRRTLGLSPTTSWLGVALNLSWLTFGLLIGDPAQIVTNAVVGTGNTAVLAALLLSQPDLREKRMVLRTAAGAAALATLAAGSLVSVAVLGAEPTAVAAAFGSVTSLVGVLAALPQLLSILVDRSQDLSGMSPARWYLGAGAAATWTTYGWLNHQPNVWLGAGFGLVCAVVTCAVLRSRRTVVPSDGFAELRPVLAVAGRRVGELVCPAHARAVLVAA